MKRLFAQLLLTLGIVLFVGRETHGKLATTTLEKLTEQADAIVIAKVEKISTVGEIKLAEASIIRSITPNKGVKKFAFLAQPTWTCDMTRAEEGETVLLFLKLPVASQDFINEKLVDDMNQASKTLGMPVLYIAHSGVGRISIVKQDGKEYVEAYNSSGSNNTELARLMAGMAQLPIELNTNSIAKSKPTERLISLNSIENKIKQWLNRTKTTKAKR